MKLPTVKLPTAALDRGSYRAPSPIATVSTRGTTPSFVGCSGLVALTLLLTAATTWAQEPVLENIEPDAQRVHGELTLEGTGFGDFVPGESRVIVGRWGDPPGNGALRLEVGTPRFWRDDRIQIQVPVGMLTEAGPRPIPRGRLAIRVARGEELSNPLPFRVIRAPPGKVLAFRQLTELDGNRDVSTVLGDPNLNLERTKDAEIGDIDGDGHPDLIDSNSFNFFGPTPGVVRLNTGRGAFEAIPLEPVNPGVIGDFATLVPPGGTFIGNGIVYDADLVDLTNDGRPELVQAVAYLGGSPRLRVLEHRGDAAGPEIFVDDTLAWLPTPAFPGNPDDLDHRDVDHDGDLDVAVALRDTSLVEILLNRDGESFAQSVVLGGAGGSAHDVFFLDADHDGWWDVFVVDEQGPSGLFVSQGDGLATFSAVRAFDHAAYQTGASGDLDGDGLDDFVLAGSAYEPGPPSSKTEVFLNDPAAPGNFVRTVLPPTGPGIVYDLELGDLDLDGDLDMVGAVLLVQPLDGDDAVVVWLGDGNGHFVEATAGGASQLLPGSGPYQRLSADLLDFDGDGDLDLYVTGADLQFVGFGLGNVPNQLYENLLIEPRGNGAP